MKSGKIQILVADKINADLSKYFHPGKYILHEKYGLNNRTILNRYGKVDCLLIRSIRQVNDNFLSRCGFKVIATVSKGTDHIDTDSAKKRNIRIINSDSGNTISAAELTLGLILNILKNINLSDKLVRGNKFGFYNFSRSDLHGKNVGIIGFGRVGSYTGKLIKAFGGKVIANDIKRSVKLKHKDFSFRSLDFLLKKSDIITIHIPLEKKNINFIDGNKMDLMKKDVILINTSRGGVIEEESLIRNLNLRKISYAGLDVFKNEPCIDKRFFKMKNVLLTNHIGGKTPESLDRMLTEIENKINKYFS